MAVHVLPAQVHPQPGRQRPHLCLAVLALNGALSVVSEASRPSLVRALQSPDRHVPEISTGPSVGDSEVCFVASDQRVNSSGNVVSTATRASHAPRPRARAEPVSLLPAAPAAVLPSR